MLRRGLARRHPDYYFFNTCVILPQRAVNATLRVNTTQSQPVGDVHCFGILRMHTEYKKWIRDDRINF